MLGSVKKIFVVLFAICRGVTLLGHQVFVIIFLGSPTMRNVWCGDTVRSLGICDNSPWSPAMRDVACGDTVRSLGICDNSPWFLCHAQCVVG